ncbi:MAG: FecR domain-containing protein, partial [Gammaproteobacteria bacterium]|nr:FecR domain-containing protein [Gammaproteobacteria bacterium]
MGITSESQIDLFESRDLAVNATANDPPLIQLIPDASFLLEGEYARVGFDLVITNPDGEQFVVEDYFAQQPPPNLMLANAAGLSPEMVKALLHQSFTDDVMFAGPATSAIGAIAIGTVKFVLGKVTATGSDGVERTLHKGDFLYKGDEIKTDGRGFIKVTMTDGTRFHLGKNSRAILNDFEFNESAGVGKFEATVLLGGFHYKSGKIGSLNPGIKHSTIKTPSAFIGIRGSELDGMVAPDGQTIVIHKSGVLEITDINGQNLVTLDVPGNTSIIVLNGTPGYFETASPAVLQLVQQSLPPPDTDNEEEAGETEAEDDIEVQKDAPEEAEAEEAIETEGEEGEQVGEAEVEESE